MLTSRHLLKTACALASDARRPNLLFMFSDRHSSDMLGCYGNKDGRIPGRPIDLLKKDLLKKANQ